MVEEAYLFTAKEFISNLAEPKFVEQMGDALLPLHWWRKKMKTEDPSRLTPALAIYKRVCSYDTVAELKSPTEHAFLFWFTNEIFEHP